MQVNNISNRLNQLIDYTPSHKYEVLVLNADYAFVNIYIIRNHSLQDTLDLMTFIRAIVPTNNIRFNLTHIQ